MSWTQQNQDPYNGNMNSSITGRPPTLNQQPQFSNSFLTSQDPMAPSQWQNQPPSLNRPPTGNTYNQPFATNTLGQSSGQNFGNQQVLTSDQLMSQFALVIQNKNPRDLHQFFDEFDCYSGRELESWELCVIFNCTEEQAALVIRDLGNRATNNLSYDRFVLTLGGQYCKFIGIGQAANQSVYSNKLRNIRMPMGTLENLAKSLLSSTQAHTYRAAFEQKVRRIGQNQINKDELRDLLQSQIPFQDLEELFTYLQIGYTQQINKIQFVQGFRQVIQEQAFKPGMQPPSQAPIQHTPLSQLNDPVSIFLTSINKYLFRQNITLQQLIRQVGGDPTSNFLNFKRFIEIGNIASAKPLSMNEENLLLKEFEDRVQKGQLNVPELERKMKQLNQIFSTDSLARDTSSDHGVNLIKDFLRRSNQQIEQVFKLTQTNPQGIVTIEKNEFKSFLTGAVGCNMEDAESICMKYELYDDATKISLSKLQTDLRTEVAAMPGVMNQELATTLTNQAFDFMKRLIALYDIILLQKFIENDISGDGKLSKKEFKIMLEKLNYEQANDQTVDGIFFLYDRSHSGFLDYREFYNKFYDYANSKAVKDPTDYAFPIFEDIRNYLKTRNTTLAKQFSADLTSALKMKEILIESFSFFEQLRFMQVKIDQRLEQKLVLRLTNAQHKVDYLVFSDLVGYQKPEEQQRPMTGLGATHLGHTQNRPLSAMGQTGNYQNNQFQKTGAKDYKKSFFKQFLRHLKITGHSVAYVQTVIGQQDVRNQQIVPFVTFVNSIQGLCQGSHLSYERQTIESIARDYDTQNQNQVSYPLFMNQLTYENDKHNLLEQFFQSLKESLEFKESNNLYEILQMFDAGRNKEFDKDEIMRMFRGRNISIGDREIEQMFDEYDVRKRGMINYYDIEADFRDFVEWDRQHRPQAKHQYELTMPQIFRMIHDYSTQTRKSLREIFKKTKIGDSDLISKFDFSRTMTEIMHNQIDSNSIDKLTQEFDVQGNNQVSFTEMLRKYNEFFHIKDDNLDQQFDESLIKKLLWHIGEVVVANKSFQIEQQFQMPNTSPIQFVKDLERPPLNCHAIATKIQLEKLANSYIRYGQVDTQGFVFEIQERANKLRTRNQTFIELKRHLEFRRTTIDEMFKNIKGLGKYRDENISKQEFYSVLMSVEFKIEMRDLEMILDTFSSDHQGKVSYVDFIKKYEETQNIGGGVNARKYFQNKEQILDTIAKCIMRNNLRNFGNLLAGYDMNGDEKIGKDSFYRVVESIQSGIGEGDIQELINQFSSFGGDVNIRHFADELNRYITDFNLKVQLKSQLNQAVRERVVEPITPSPRRAVDKQLFGEQQKLILDIVCGLITKNRDAQSWFNSFSRQSPGLVTNTEFMTAINSLEVQALESDKRGLYEVIQSAQDMQTTQRTQNLSIDFVSQYFLRQCPQNQQQVFKMIMLDIAKELSVNKIPVQDTFVNYFDRDKQGFVFRNDFGTAILLDTFKLNTVLTPNKINILNMKYDPSSTFRIFYDQFINDLRLTEQENQRDIRIVYTSFDVPQTSSNRPGSAMNLDSRQSYRPPEPEPEAQSKKNTVVTEQQIARMQDIRVQQIPSIQFEDIMLATYKRGQAVEPYFKQFGKNVSGQFQLDKDCFFEAIKKLGVAWLDQNKVSMMFDEIDKTAHRQYSRSITPDELGIAVFQNCQMNVEDFQSKTLSQVHRELKRQDLLPKLRDILNFFNSRRDNTCASEDFKQTMLFKFYMKNSISESDMDVLIRKYAVMKDGSRLDFTVFLRDIELMEKGISPSMNWASEMAENIIKALTVGNYQNMNQFFDKFSQYKGLLLIDEFKRAMDELQLSYIHNEQQMRDFYNNIEISDNKGGQYGQITKVGIPQLILTVEKLCPKTPLQLSQEILEKIYGESKKMNVSISVYHMFTNVDPQKRGVISFQDFKYGIQTTLNVKNVKDLDIAYLAKKYRTNQGQDTVQYQKFYDDYELIEKQGLRAGGSDALQRKTPSGPLPSNQPLELPPDVKELYANMGNFLRNKRLIDPLISELVKRDSRKTGFLNEQSIGEAAKLNQMKLSSKQLNLLMLVLPYDKSDNAYNYMSMVELLFGKQKQSEITQKYGIRAPASGFSMVEPVNQKVEFRQRFKDLIELKLQLLITVANQTSKGTYQLRETEFYGIFKRADIVINSSDMQMLQLAFRQQANKQTGQIDFSEFIKFLNIQDRTSKFLEEIQKDVTAFKIQVTTSFVQDEVSYQEFKEFLKNKKLAETYQRDETLIERLFLIISEGKQRAERNEINRVFQTFQPLKEEVLPFIVHELVNFIINSQIDISKHVNPNAAKLTRQQFDSILTALKFRPSNPKDMPQLYTYLAFDGDAFNISQQKLLDQLAKADPKYASFVHGQPAAGNRNVTEKQGILRSAKAAQLKISEFSPKIKQLLSRINDTLKRQGIQSAQLFNMIDSNKNGLLDIQEFSQFFTQKLPIQGVMAGEYEILFESLDTNKDGHMSVNEFCLYLEGAQLSEQQKHMQFDQDMEKELLANIDELFVFFDKNRDGTISSEEVYKALRSVNQNVSQKAAQDMVSQIDKNKDGVISRQEFVAFMLPKLREERLMVENNLEDLRKLFKEADVDNSGYLSSQELRYALNKIGVELTQEQIDDLMKEMDENESQMIDIDEFVAFLSIADSLKFKNRTSRSTVIKIRNASKLHPIDFLNSFKNLPQFFNSSFTQDRMEKMNKNCPSLGLQPKFDFKSMQFEDLNKLGSYSKIPNKEFIQTYLPGLACEIQIEEAENIPMPKPEEFDWKNITHREVRACLYDFSTQEYMSNMFIVQANWRLADETKWLFNINPSLAQGKNFYVRTDLVNKPTLGAQPTRDLRLIFELVIYTKNPAKGLQQQISCVWGSLPCNTLDKASKHKIPLKGGSPASEAAVTQDDIYQSKKGFQFLKKVVGSTNDATLIVNVKPWTKFQENTQVQLAMLPSTVLVPKRLLSFAAAFRFYCYKKLLKSISQMVLPDGNVSIAQFKQIYDNPDLNLIMGECWDIEVTQTLTNQINYEVLAAKVEQFLSKLYCLIYSPSFEYDFIYPTRSIAYESDLYINRENLIKQALVTNKAKLGKLRAPLKPAEQIPSYGNYKPFNIREMEIPIAEFDQVLSKQTDLLQMYQNMGQIA